MLVKWSPGIHSYITYTVFVFKLNTSANYHCCHLFLTGKTILSCSHQNVAAAVDQSWITSFRLWDASGIRNVLCVRWVCYSNFYQAFTQNKMCPSPKMGIWICILISQSRCISVILCMYRNKKYSMHTHETRFQSVINMSVKEDFLAPQIFIY